MVAVIVVIVAAVAAVAVEFVESNSKRETQLQKLVHGEVGCVRESECAGVSE